MDVGNDCIIEEVIPSRTKKMKQARLSFSKLTPSKSLLNNVSSKKRKLESPKESKTAKIIKVTAKENSAEDIELIDNVLNEAKTLSSSKNNSEITDIENKEEETPHKSQHYDKDRSSKSKSKRSLFSKTKKKESRSPNTSLTKFLMKKNKKDDQNTSMDDNTKEKTEQSNISSSQNSNENSDIDSNIINDDELDIIIDDTEKSNNTSLNNTSQTDKSLCVDSDSEIDISSDDEDNTKESENKKTANLNVKVLCTPTQTTEVKKLNITKNKKVTLKQLQKKDSAKKRKEREQLRLEKERKREEERENRRKKKAEKRKEKEEKERAEREQKKKERAQKELKKQMEIEQKQKEKEVKEQERRKKEEEKKRKEEEKLECERKKQKAASTFASFFVPKKQEIKSMEEENNTSVQTFMPFEVKADMRIAPICRWSLDYNEKLSLDDKLNKGHTETSNLYLAEMKNKKIIRHKSEKTWPFEAKDIIILDEEENDSNSDVVFQPEIVVDKTRPKLLQFHENRRPPYWGTWRKQSDSINPRRPFSKDSKWFDYEVDSDEEWEEEEPGESLHGSEDEKDEENLDDNEYDVDNEFMVPHGYLSDEEARPDEEEDITMTPETQKFKLKLLGEQFEAERTAKMSKLKPRIIGCIWLGSNNEYPENTPKKVVEFLTARHAWVSQIPVVLPSSMNENADVDGTPGRTQTSARKTKVPTEALADLIRLVHGNRHGKNFLVKEFLTFWNKQTASKDNQISKVSLVTKISEIGKWMPCPDEGQMHLKACWYVPEDLRKQILGEDEELVLPNRWKYNLTPKRKSEINSDNNDKTEKLEKDTDKDKKKVPLITQFTKKITQEEMQRQLATKPKQSVTPKPILQRPPKRAVLISIPKNDKVPVITIEEPVGKKLEDSKGKL